MAQIVTNLDPRTLDKNPENPRLIFHGDELETLQDSISVNGILVPLTVYKDGRTYYLIDGERRWRCALKLALRQVPVIIQPKPDRLQNIMMMFAIHNARRDWDPLPTAYKLVELEKEYRKVEGRSPTEAELAELASLSRGEVRRLRKLLKLPEKYRNELMKELKKPRSDQKLTVDHVIEATNAAGSLRKREIVSAKEEDLVRQAIVDKFRSGVIENTVAPRKLARLARAVERDEVSISQARKVTLRLIREPRYSIDQAFAESVEKVDFEHSIEQLAERLEARLREHLKRGYQMNDALRVALKKLESLIHRL